ncbi:YqzE family protein [Sporolactobacillus vineae]|uniref:YqzE family protein n=1 Tax=Sporolactobacillus vineae TaxID=444463 RepID=UPI00028A0F55|nr:YqzE family protein [Sporolactobacillus vineae]
MKSEDYVKYLTEQLVRYMETPREQRRRSRLESRAARPALRNQLFGQIPDAIENYIRRLSSIVKQKHL